MAKFSAAPFSLKYVALPNTGLQVGLATSSEAITDERQGQHEETNLGRPEQPQSQSRRVARKAIEYWVMRFAATPTSRSWTSARITSKAHTRAKGKFQKGVGVSREDYAGDTGKSNEPTKKKRASLRHRMHQGGRVLSVEPYMAGSHCSSVAPPPKAAVFPAWSPQSD